MQFTAPIVILDCEMSGTDVSTHQILEVGAYLCDPKNLGILSQFYSLVGPDAGKSISRVKAESSASGMLVNGIDIDRLEYSKPIEQVLVDLNSWLPPAPFIWVGYDICLDYAFLHKYTEGGKPGNRLLKGRKVDLKTLVELWIATKAVKLGTMGLSSVAEHLGIEAARAHTALGDCAIIRQVFKYILKELDVKR